MINETDIPKYKKKKDSSVSSAKRKTKHRHEYAECLMVSTGRVEHINKATYCKLCGKIGEHRFFETETTEHGFLRFLSNQEIHKKYNYLPTFYVKNIFKQKYVILDSEKGGAE